MKARGTLLMELPNKDQPKFHSYKDAKLLMEAIEKTYRGNKKSKKVQRTLLKQQYENFAASSSETLDQTFDSLPSEWKTHALIWRKKADIETISLDDLYSNLKIYEPELAGSSSISQNPQNVAFVSPNSTSSTNEADNTAFGVSTAHSQASSSETLDQTFDRLKKLISQLEIQGEVIEQEDMTLKLLKSLPSELKTHALIWRKKADIETISLDDFTNEANNTAFGVSTAHSQGEDTNQPSPPPIAPPEAPQMVSSVKLHILKKVMLNGNGEVQITKDEAGNELEVPPVTAQKILARTRERKAKSTLLMAIPDEHLARFYGIKDAKTLWDAIKTRFGESTSSTNELNAAYSVSTATSYSSQAQGSSSYTDELMFSFFANQSSSSQLDDEDLELIDQDDLEETDLKWQVAMHSMRVKDCRTAWNLGNRGRDAGNVGYRGGDNGKRHAREEDEKALFNEKEVLDVKEEEVTENVLDNHSSDEENSLAIDRFKKGEGFHAVPPPLTGNYMPSKPDLYFVGLDDSIYKFKISETVTSLFKDVKDALETSIAFVEKPEEVRTSALIIQEWETDSDNNSVFRPKHILAKINFVKADRMAKKSVLPNNVRKGTGHMENTPVWNNVQRINHQNKFAPTAVFTRSGRIPVSAAKPKAAASTSAAKSVNTTGPKQSVNFSNSRSTFHKSHSPIRRYFYNATTHSRSNSTERVFNTVGSKAVSAVKENRVTAVKASTSCVWRPRVNDIYQISKENRWICTRVDYGHPQQALKNKGIVDIRCSRHMTGNKAYLADY
uniref:Ribonuclease H-like domain-containing protein n=1 Tax=Tanacetum cinerariifolium TaxID=118510 RepID=A0A6L2LAE0_TANCI|nr:ribonuclease H-like domain-containing protein [Tanacetum cinerariifolium]